MLASSLAKGIPEKTIINNLILLSKNKVCSNSQNAELAVSTQSFAPPNNTLSLLSGRQANFIAFLKKIWN